MSKGILPNFAMMTCRRDIRSAATTLSFVLAAMMSQAQESKDPRARIPDGISLLEDHDEIVENNHHTLHPDISSIPLQEMPLGIFCKWEDQLNARAKFPIAIRLHSFEHAERMDGKGTFR